MADLPVGQVVALHCWDPRHDITGRLVGINRDLGGDWVWVVVETGDSRRWYRSSMVAWMEELRG